MAAGLPFTFLSLKPSKRYCRLSQALRDVRALQDPRGLVHKLSRHHAPVCVGLSCRGWLSQARVELLLCDACRISERGKRAKDTGLFLSIQNLDLVGDT